MCTPPTPPVPADVVDHGTGQVRVLARRCATCLFRPGDPMSLGVERVREVIEENLRAGALLTCHAPTATTQTSGQPYVLASGPATATPSPPDASTNSSSASSTSSLRTAGPTRNRLRSARRAVPPQDRSRHPAHQDESDPGPHPRCGDRIRLVATSDPYTALESGALGTVTGADSLGTIHVRWDNGSTLGLIPDLDRFDIINL